MNLVFPYSENGVLVSSDSFQITLIGHVLVVTSKCRTSFCFGECLSALISWTNKQTFVVLIELTKYNDRLLRKTYFTYNYFHYDYIYTCITTCTPVWLHVHLYDYMYTCITTCTPVWLHVHLYDYFYTCMTSCTPVWLHLHLYDYIYTCMTTFTPVWLHVYLYD